MCNSVIVKQGIFYPSSPFLGEYYFKSRIIIFVSWVNNSVILDFKLSPCCSNDELSSGYFPGVWVLKADLSEHCVSSIFNRWWSVSLLKMEPTQCSETSAFNTQTPAKYPEDNSSRWGLFQMTIWFGIYHIWRWCHLATWHHVVWL
jgi:hypothetical protein